MIIILKLNSVIILLIEKVLHIMESMFNDV